MQTSCGFDAYGQSKAKPLIAGAVLATIEAIVMALSRKLLSE